MYFLFSLLLIIPTTIFSDNVPANINQEVSVSALVDGCVNAITGDFIDSSNDLVIVGPEPLVFERFHASSDYTANNFLSSWRHTHDAWIYSKETEENSKTLSYKMTFVEGSGRVGTYSGSAKREKSHQKFPKHAYATLSLPDYGFTNCGSGVIGAKTNPKNNVAVYDLKNKDIKVKMSSGSELHFKRNKENRVFDLVKEKKPNTRKKLYTYDKEHYLESISLMDKAMQHTFGKITFSKSKDKYGNRMLKLNASDGQEVIYQIEKGDNTESDKEQGIKKRFLLKSVIRQGLETDRYEYTERRGTGGTLITQHIKPEGRFKQIKYYSDKTDSKIKNKYHYSVNRVRTLKSPVGTDQQPYATYRFLYHADEWKSHDQYQHAVSGFTEVLNAHNNRTIYYFNKYKLTAIEKDIGYNPFRLFSIERFFWENDAHADVSNLLSKCLQDHLRNTLTARVFTYDPSGNGNIIHDRFYGNITGNSAPLIWAEKAPLQNNSDSYAHHYTYSNDKFHLLMTDSEDNGKAIYYSYHTNSDLLKSTITLEHGIIRQRNFYDYDANGVLIKSLSDDGNTYDLNNLQGVTQRLITYTTAQNCAPFGVPLQTDEKYLDLKTGYEVLLKSIIREFSPQGRITKEIHKDSNGIDQYTLTWQYDAQGNDIYHTNAKGQATIKKYDANKNLLYEYTEGERHYKQYSYDFANRLILSEEIFDDGITFTTRHGYDLLGNRIFTEDPYGHKTTYSYDEFAQLNGSTFPPLPDPQGPLKSPSMVKLHNPLGHNIYSKNQLDGVTHTSYNAYGKPLHIIYPDGSQERFEYNLDGTLRKQIEKNGSYVIYLRDLFDRPLIKELYSSSNEQLSVESATYNTFHQLTSTDAEGRLTEYHYDDAGRLIEIIQPGGRKTYEYDSMGRIHKTHDWVNAAQKKTTIKIFDVLDQILEERIEQEGQIVERICYLYDPAGNVVQRTQYDSEGNAEIKITEFNPRKLPTKTIDPLGHTTHLQYNYNTIDDYGLRVLQTTVTDPNGNQIITTHNTHSKIGSIIKKNALAIVTAKKELFYNGLGNLIHTSETIITPGGPNKVINTSWDHNSANQLTDIYEAIGTQEQRHTQNVYNSFGQKTTLIKPDGTKINFIYDFKGRLQKHQGDDFYYEYTYDRTDKILAATDLLQRFTTRRQYNPEGRLALEELGNGLTFYYHYDALGRPVALILPDKSTIEYRYDACNLLQISRNGYQHTYNDYHHIGIPQKTTLPRNAGTLLTNYDLAGHLKSIHSKGFKEELEYDPLGNLLSVKLEGIVSRYTYDDLYQLQTETGASTHTYTCDSLYNCVLRDGKLRTFNLLNQLIEEGETTYAYDASGNLIKKETPVSVTTYRYDTLDRLIGVINNGKETHYLYDAFNRRIFKILPTGEKITYLYQGDNEVGSADLAGHIQELRILGIGKGAEIGASVAFEIGGILTIPIHDHNGNVIALLDEAGKTLESYRYSAFGEETIYDADGNKIETCHTPWRYASKRVDPETGFSYFGRRYYDPHASRWITPDPMGYATGSNLYAYVLNNPLTHIDLYGLMVSQTAASRSLFSPLASAVRWGLNNLATLAALPGRCVEIIGHHLLPIPIVQDVVKMCGRFMSGQGLNWIPWRDEFSYPHSIGDENNQEGRIPTSIAHGMNVDEHSSWEMLKQSSEALGGVCLNMFHSATHGTIADLISCMALIVGIPTAAVGELAKNLRHQLQEISGPMHMSAHSRGGLVLNLALKMLSPDERKRLIVSTYGSAKIIDAKALGLIDATNYVSIKDPIPFLADPIGCFKGAMSDYGNTKYFISEGYFAADHAFDKGYIAQFKMRDFLVSNTYGSHY